MSALRVRAGEYLAMRRALGFRLESWGPRLMSFVRFCEDRGATTVTTGLAVEWATSTASDHEAYQARRLDVVRIFARHLQPLDPATEVPPEDVLDRRQCRIPPYLYSPQEVTALMSAARTLRPAFRAVTWRTLIGLLAVTGMRQGEACRLRRGDVDLNAGTEKGRADTHVTAHDGRAVCLVTGEPSGLSVTLPKALKELTKAAGPGAKIMLGFDRGGAYPQVFRHCRDQGVHWVTYRRAPLAVPAMLPVITTITAAGRRRQVAWAGETGPPR